MECAADPPLNRSAYATGRLAVILGAYTVDLDLWLCGSDGRDIAHGRPERFGSIVGRDVTGEPRFWNAAGLPDGDAYIAADVALVPASEAPRSPPSAPASAKAAVAGEAPSALLAIHLVIHFDWEPQARSIVEGVRVDPADRARTGVLLVDAHRRVLASSGPRRLLQEILAFQPGDRRSGADLSDALIAFHRTPGYETYAGLGWYGVIVQTPEDRRTVTR